MCVQGAEFDKRFIPSVIGLFEVQHFSRLLKNSFIQPFFTYRRNFYIPDGI
jgi:hypothetical protein